MSHATTPHADATPWWNPVHWRLSVWMILLAIMASVLPFGIRWFFLSQVPVMADPFDVTAFVGEPVPDAENAFTEYRQVIEMLKSLNSASLSSSLSRRIHKSEELDWDPNDEEMRAWIEQHREVLALWIQATEKNRALSFDLTKASLSTPVEHYLELHRLGQTALAEQGRLLHEGKVEEAWKLARATLRCGGHVSCRSTLLNGLLGMTIHEAAFGGVRRWAEHPSVTAEQLRSALAKIRSDFTLYDAESSMMKLEYVVFRDALRQRNVFLELADTGAVTPFANPVLRYGRAAMLWMNGEPNLTQRLLAQITTNQLREVDQPVSERRKLITSAPTILFDTDDLPNRAAGELTGSQIQNALKLSSISGLIASSRKQFDQCYQALLARQAVLETLLALQAYRREHGEFPERLDQLVASFLDAVPRDPCDSTGNPLIYRRQSAQQATLYSVGPNGVDDEGILGASNRSHDIGVELK
jgi:hypothetical protein